MNESFVCMLVSRPTVTSVPVSCGSRLHTLSFRAPQVRVKSGDHGGLSIAPVRTVVC
jgi:hypothetical protein